MPTHKHRRPEITNGPDELTLREVAELLGMHRGTLFRLKDRFLAGKSGGIEAYHTDDRGWVVTRAAFERFRRAREKSEKAHYDTLTEQTLRRIYGKIGAAERIAFENLREMTAPARQEHRSRWEREVDPDGTMDPTERARRVAQLERAHMYRMTMIRLQRHQGASGE